MRIVPRELEIFLSKTKANCKFFLRYKGKSVVRTVGERIEVLARRGKAAWNAYMLYLKGILKVPDVSGRFRAIECGTALEWVKIHGSVALA